jgi:thymidine kinase
MQHFISEHQGWIEVVCGSMYSGKTEELLKRIQRATIAKQKVIVFKPLIDDRYAKDYVVSHDKNKIEATIIENPRDILLLAKNADVIGIDEIQFMDHSVIEIVSVLANAGKRVIVAGLDMDYMGRPFGPMPELMAIAEDVTKNHAICVVCGNPAQYSQRIVPEDSLIAIGSDNMYEARCRNCFVKPHK